MIAPRWIKLWRDAVAARGRLALIIGAVAASVAALATMAIASDVLTREVPRNYLGSNPASAQLELAAEPDAALLARVRQRSDIAQAELAATLRGRIERGPGDWAPLLLFVVPDFSTLAVNMVHPEVGAWPPATGTLLVERSALPLTRRAVGAAITIALPHGGRRDIVIAGTVHDPGVAPAGQEQTVYGYVTPATLAALGEPVPLTLLKVVVARDAGDAAAIERTTRALSTWLAAQGASVEQIRIPTPRRHPHQAQMNAILAMLTGFSALALVLGAVLCATVIGALLAQQVRQIAIMKAIGARTRQVALPLLVLVALLGALATAIGLPLGITAANAFVRAIAQLLNLRIENTSASTGLLGWLMLPGIVLPVLAAAWPVAAAARRSVRAALDDHGAGNELGALARLAARVRTGGVASTLALRNSLRRRTRLLLTLALLASAGAMLETCLAVRVAWTDNVARAAQQRRWDLELGLQAPAPLERVTTLLRALPVVSAVEPWNGTGAARAAPDGLEVVHTYPDGGHGGFGLRSAPPDTRMIVPHVVAGRWLQAGDADGVVLNTTAWAIAFGDARVGDLITLAVDHRPTSLRLVGVIDETLTPGAAYVAPATYERATGTGATVSVLRIALREPVDDATALAAISQALVRDGLAVRGAISARQFAAAQGGHVAILVAALGFIAVLMSVVGLLGLASALSVSSAERTREFGVMRALGASRGVVLRVVLVEGLVIGVASWAAAIALSWPLSTVVARVLASIAAQDLAPRFDGGAIVGLLAALLVGATVASLAPALRASRWTVRESLALA
ncbi:MAG: FtsX-like permease family protein [Burkholderiaceae bacterium]